MPTSAPTTPEIAASVFPWDLADEGVDRVLDNFQELAGVNSVYLCHLSENTRPYYGGTYPHNPVRKSYTAEPCRIYWPATPRYYGRIKPLGSERNFLAGDWMSRLIRAARGRGMKVGAELFHGYLDQARLNGEFVELRQVDIFGSPIRTHDYGNHASCLNNPDFQEYAVGLFSDLSANYDLDFIQTCMIPYVLPPEYLDRIPCDTDPINWALAAPRGGGCFCRQCMEAASADGFDLAGARRTLKHLAEQDWQPILASGITAADYLAEQPLLKRWLDFRRDSVNRLYARIAKAAKSLRPGIDLRWNHYTINHSYYSGIDLSTLAEHISSIRVHAMVEQHGRTELVEAKMTFLGQFAANVPQNVRWLPAIDIRGRDPQAAPAVLTVSARRVADLGCHGCVLSHYGSAPLENLAAVKRGLAESLWGPALGLASPGALE